MLEIEPTAYPIAGGEISMPFVNEKGGTEIKTVQIRQQFGLSMLDHFAGLAMQAFISKNSQTCKGNNSMFFVSPDGGEAESNCRKSLAESCYDMAEFMMDEREKRQANKDAK